MVGVVVVVEFNTTQLVASVLAVAEGERETGVETCAAGIGQLAELQINNMSIANVDKRLSLRGDTFPSCIRPTQCLTAKATNSYFSLPPSLPPMCDVISF